MVLVGAVLGVLGVAVARTDGGSSEEYTVGVPSPVVGPHGPADTAEGSAGRTASGALPEAAEPAAPVLPGDAAAPEPPPPAGDAPFPPAGFPDAIGHDVVRTAQLTLQVADPAAGARSVRTAVATAGGFVAQEQVDTTSSWLVLRVPAAGLDRLLDDLAATGTVLSRSGRTEDATAQVVDLDSRVATQQASVTRVRALLAQATSIGDVVTVESELARREADLEALQRRVAALRDRVALSTVTVELRGPAATPPPDTAPPGFGSGLGAGWAGLRSWPPWRRPRSGSCCLSCRCSPWPRAWCGWCCAGAGGGAARARRGESDPGPPLGGSRGTGVRASARPAVRHDPLSAPPVDRGIGGVARSAGPAVVGSRGRLSVAVAPACRGGHDGTFEDPRQDLDAAPFGWPVVAGKPRSRNHVAGRWLC